MVPQEGPINQGIHKTMEQQTLKAAFANGLYLERHNAWDLGNEGIFLLPAEPGVHDGLGPKPMYHAQLLIHRPTKRYTIMISRNNLIDGFPSSMGKDVLASSPWIPKDHTYRKMFMGVETLEIAEDKTGLYFHTVDAQTR